MAGECVYDQEQIRNSVEQFYVNLYTDLILVKPTLVRVDFNFISEDLSR